MVANWPGMGFESRSRDNISHFHHTHDSMILQIKMGMKYNYAIIKYFKSYIAVISYIGI